MNKAYYPFLFTLILAFGMYFGYKIQERNVARSKVFNTEGSSKIDYILRLIDARYVDTVNQEKLYDDAIVRMLEDLDPHSVYLPPIQMSHEAEIMEGNFEGIGIEFAITNDTIQVVTPISGGPSEQVGVSAGDKIIKVNDTLVAGIKITNEMVMKKLKGPKGSIVKVTMLKSNTKKLVTYTIKRDKIPLYSVDAGFMLDGKTGYIKINRFAKTTYQEFMVKLDTLTQRGMTGLILDLRQNPGGFMDQATSILDELLDGNKTMVYTEGRAYAKTYEKARKSGMFEDGKVVVLIDEGSASASEIISGAIQDWDRGLLIGRRTFGKGLVQQEYPLGDGSSVRLTIAKYYTPSGRSIQRPYSDNVESYYEDINTRYKDGEVFSQDSIKNNTKQIYKTLVKGRTVYGGGGITPDIFIPLDTSMFNPLVNDIFGRGVISEFAYDYLDKQKATFDAYKSAEQFQATFTVSPAMYAAFIQYCYAQGVPKDLAAYTEKSRDYISTRIKAFIARKKWNTSGFYQVVVHDDKMVQRALLELKK